MRRARCCGDLHQAEGEEWGSREDPANAAVASTRHGVMGPPGSGRPGLRGAAAGERGLLGGGGSRRCG